jgi:hypothetical protein
MNVRFAVFMAIVIFNGYSGWLMTQVFPGLDQRIRIATVACDGLMVVMALTVMFRNRRFYGSRVMAVFLLAATVTVIYNADKIGILSQLNGLRQPLFFFSSLVVLYDFIQSPIRDRFIKVFSTFLVVWGLSQIPTSFLQFLKYGANDNVGGTFGLTGGSGLVTQLVFLIMFYLVARYGSLEDGERYSTAKVLLFSGLLIPCLLNETKISFVFLAMYLLLLTRVRRLWRTLPLLVFGGLMIYGLLYYYESTVGGVEEIASDKFLKRYLFYDPRQHTDIPRLQKVVLAVNLVSKDIVTFFFGTGYGLFTGKSILGTSRLGRSLSYFEGTRSLLSTLWLEGGLAGVAVFGVAMSAFFRWPRLQSFVTRRFALFLLAGMVLIWVYNEAILDRTFAAIFTFMMLLVYTDTLHVGTNASGLAEKEIPPTEAPLGEGDA